MGMKVKAVEKLLKFNKNENDPGVWRYVMQPELYMAQSQKKVIRETNYTKALKNCDYPISFSYICSR